MHNITCTDFHQLPFWKSWLEQVDSWHFNCWFEQVDLLDDTIKGEETLNIFKAVGTNQDMHVIFDIISSFVGIWWQRKKMEQLVRLYLMNSNDSSRWLLDSWYFDNLRYTDIYGMLMSRWCLVDYEGYEFLILAVHGQAIAPENYAAEEAHGDPTGIVARLAWDRFG